MYYLVNYGYSYIEGIMASDGEEQDAYILGANESVDKFAGKIIAIVHRKDNIEEKWVVVTAWNDIFKRRDQKENSFARAIFRQ